MGTDLNAATVAANLYERGLAKPVASLRGCAPGRLRVNPTAICVLICVSCQFSESHYGEGYPV
jgi:hypothetical protein